MEDGKQKKHGKGKEEKAKSKKSQDHAKDADAELDDLLAEVAALKEKVKKIRLAGCDIEGKEYFEKNPVTFEKGKKPAEQQKLTKGHIGKIEAIAWGNSNPECVLTAGLDGRLLLWHAPSGNKLQLYKLKSQWIQACALRNFTAETGVVASGGMDNICTLYSIQDNVKPLKELTGHSGFISGCKFISNEQLITASSDCTCILWDVQKEKDIQTFHLATGASTLAVAKSGDSFLAGLTNGVVSLCDVKIGRSVADYEAHEESISAIAFFPDPTAYATASDDLTCRLYDLRNADNILQSYDIPENSSTTDLTSLVFSQSGRYLFAAYDDMIRVWDTASGKTVYELVPGTKSTSLDINCDGNALCSGGEDNDGRVWTI